MLTFLHEILFFVVVLKLTGFLKAYILLKYIKIVILNILIAEKLMSLTLLFVKN